VSIIHAHFAQCEDVLVVNQQFVQSDHIKVLVKLSLSENLANSAKNYQNRYWLNRKHKSTRP